MKRLYFVQFKYSTDHSGRSTLISLIKCHYNITVVLLNLLRSFVLVFSISININMYDIIKCPIDKNNKLSTNAWKQIIQGWQTKDNWNVSSSIKHFNVFKHLKLYLSLCCDRLTCSIVLKLAHHIFWLRPHCWELIHCLIRLFIMSTRESHIFIYIWI